MTKKSKKDNNLDQAFVELEEIVAEFEQGEVDLEKSINKFKKGLKLAKFLKKKLSQMENEIKEVKADYSKMELDEADEEPSETEELNQDKKDQQLPF